MSCMFQHKQQAETLQWSVPQRRMLGPFHRERDKEGMILVDLGACEEVKKEHRWKKEKKTKQRTTIMSREA